jgi:predicted nucleic acid-binding Zn ribbon protein
MENLFDTTLHNGTFVAFTKTEHHRMPTHVCAHCFKRFQTAQGVLEHVRVKHPATAVQQRVRAQQAVPQVPKAKKYACLQCTGKFQDAQTLASHVRAKHPAAVQQRVRAQLAVAQACACCEETFATDAALVQHMQKEHPALECSACGASFKHAQDLLRHHRYVHEPVPCQHCLHLMHTLAQLQIVFRDMYVRAKVLVFSAFF